MVLPCIKQADLSGQQHIQQVPGGGEAAAQGVPGLAAAHVHLVALLLHLVAPQVHQAQHNDAALAATQAHVAPVCGIHLHPHSLAHNHPFGSLIT